MNTPTLALLLADSDRYGDREGKGVFFLVTLALVGTAIFFVVRGIRQRRNGDEQDRAGARRLLDERFARGDIDRADYEHRRAVLDGDDVIPPAPARTPHVEPPTGDDAASDGESDETP